MVLLGTKLSKGITALLLCGFVLQYFLPDVRAYLALVPGKTLPMVWNLVSSGFLITSPVELVVNAAVLLVVSRSDCCETIEVEPVWGTKEFLRFILIVELMVSCTVFLAVYVMYASAPLTRGALLYTQFSGFHGVSAGLLVAVKQVMSHHEFRALGPLRFRARFLPSLALVFFLGFVYMTDRWDLLAFYLPGTYLSWVYLRFFQLQPHTSGVYGDSSDEFKFSSFFPDFLATPIDWLASAVSMITRLRHAPGAEGRSGHHLVGMPSALGSDSAEASRRRERGAKALEERLKGTQSQAPVHQDVEGGTKGLVVAADATSS